MSNLIQFKYKDNWISKLDVRSKLFFAFNMLIISILIQSIVVLLMYLSIIYLIISLNYGFKEFPKLLWYMKYFLLLIIIINFIIVRGIDIDIYIVGLRIIVLIFSFYIFNKSTNPDQIVDALIKLKIPASIAWIIGSTLRQSIFLIDDVSDVMAIHKIRSDFENNSKDDQSWWTKLFAKTEKTLNLAQPLINSTFSRAILNASTYGDVLYIRGWQGAHKEISLYNSKFSKIDYIFMILTIILPNSIAFYIINLNIF